MPPQKAFIDILFMIDNTVTSDPPQLLAAAIALVIFGSPYQY